MTITPIMTRTQSLAGTRYISLLVAAMALIACKPAVPQEDIDAALRWSMDICRCKDKPVDEQVACYDAHPMPVIEGKKYSQKSIELYLDASRQGRSCLIELENFNDTLKQRMKNRR